MGAQNRAIIDKLLTGASQKIVSVGHIAELLLPSIKVKARTGKLGKYGQGHLRIVNTVVGGRGKFRQIEGVARSNVGYEIEGHGLEGMVTQEDYDNVELPYDAERDETELLTSMLQLEKEKGLADALSNTSVITQNTTLSGGDQFDDYANSDPLAVALDAREAILDSTGLPPNAMWMDEKVKMRLKFHPQLLDRLGFKEARPGGLTDAELAAALDVQKVLVAGAFYQAAKEGQTEGSFTRIWGKHLWFGVIPDAAALNQVSLGYRVELASRAPRQVSKWAINNPEGATAILCSDHYDQLLSMVGACYLVKNAIS